VHRALAAELVRLALEALAPQEGEAVFDLYAGVGLFSAFLAQAGARIVAVEASPSACTDFEVNLAEFDDVELYEASVEVALPAIERKPDAVLVDPPRAGLEPPALDALLDLAPGRLVYVSCDPATLARDGKRLAQAGYRLERVTPLDLFPQTYHIETVSRWVR
jgi:23S rRNA (uracil1939-C5)-methyltransferase